MKTKMLKHGKRVFSVVVALAVIAMSLFTASASSAHASTTDEWDANYPIETLDAFLATQAEGCDGTAEHPYIISTVAQLVYVTSIVGRDSAGKYYKVDDSVGAFNMANYALGTTAQEIKDAGVPEWVRYYYEGGEFQGTFDGNGVIIYGISAKGNAGGLFRKAKNATIKNVSVQSSSFCTSGGPYAQGVGAIVAWATGSVTVENCEIKNCYLWAEIKDGGSQTVCIGSVIGNGGATGHTIKNVLVDGVIFDSNGMQAPWGNFIGSTNSWSGVTYENVVAFNGALPYAMNNDNFQVEGATTSDPDAVAYNNVYVTDDVNLVDVVVYPGSDNATRDFTGHVVALSDIADIDQYTTKEGTEGMDWENTWILTENGPVLRVFHNFVSNAHTEACACGVQGIATPHEFENGRCTICEYECQHDNLTDEDFVEEAPADCVNDNRGHYVCPDCGLVGETESTISATGHNFGDVHDAVPPTCDADGTLAYKTCANCNLNYAADAADNAAFEAALGSIANTNRPDHTPAAEWSFDADGHYKVCTECDGEVDRADHEFGDDRICDICEYEKLGEIVIPEESGVYTITPAEVTVLDKNGYEVAYNEAKEGWILVAGEEYTIIPDDTSAEVAIALDKALDAVFNDANSEAWYNNAVTYAVGSGIMTGYADGSGNFGITDGIQRQDFLVMLARYDGVDLTAYAGAGASFDDVDPNAYYAAAVAWGADVGITTGYDDGNFGVGDKITREQLVTFLYRYADYIGVDTTYSPETEADVEGRVDFDDISGFSSEAILWAVDKGVISGNDDDGSIAPQGDAQRCAVAQIMFNIYKNNVL